MCGHGRAYPGERPRAHHFAADAGEAAVPSGDRLGLMRESTRKVCGPRHVVRTHEVQGSAVVRAPLKVQGRKWLMTCVSMGNPHAVTFGTQGADIEVCTSRPPAAPASTHKRRTSELVSCLQIDDLDLPAIGPVFERHEVFPARINTEFVQVRSATPMLVHSTCSTDLHCCNGCGQPADHVHWPQLT